MARGFLRRLAVIPRGSDLNLKMEDKIENCRFDRRDENPTFSLSSPNSQTLLVKNPTAAASSRTAPLVGRSAPGCCPVLEGIKRMHIRLLGRGKVGYLPRLSGIFLGRSPPRGDTARGFQGFWGLPKQGCWYLPRQVSSPNLIGPTYYQ